MKFDRVTIEPINECDLLEQIRDRATRPGALDMSTWHTCNTTHCLAGWAQFLAGDMNAQTESEGRRLIPSASHLFFEKDDVARAWLETRAWKEENRSAFHDALRNIGVRVVTGDETYDWTGGDCWADGNATINQQASQTGGYCRAYGNATINQLETVEA